MKSFPIMTYAVQSAGPVLSGLMLDNGPALLAAYLQDNGYSPRIFDYNNVETYRQIAVKGKRAFLERTVEELDYEIKSTGAKVLGSKLYANGFKDNAWILQQLRLRNPKLIVVGGGPQVAWFGPELFKYNDVFDALVYGNGDDAIVSIARAVYDGGTLADANGMLLKDGRKNRIFVSDLKDLPMPIYDPEVYIGLNGKMMIPVVEDSRSCYMRCSFCLHWLVGGPVRVRPIEEVAREMEHYKSKEMGVSRLAGANPKPEYVNDLVARLSPETRISAFGYSNPGYDFKNLSGKIIALFIGVESTDPEVLRRYRKTTNPERYLRHAKEMIQGCREAGIATIVSMIIPSPFDTDASIDKNAEWVLDANPDFATALPLGLFFGTELMKQAEQEEECGIRLHTGFKKKFMDFEMDNLRPPTEQPTIPYDMVINGKMTNSIFSATGRFVTAMAKHGIFPLSDEIALMAYLYHKGLSNDQDERRKQCIDFHEKGRKMIVQGDHEGLDSMVRRINKCQSEIARGI
ncbi:MAG TPA: radical SAM protein [Candidatus Nanoarchaeia archaeon]|nr:radical SAM protein [Candidatus Nanoarchaeia archaeon]